MGNIHQNIMTFAVSQTKQRLVKDLKFVSHRLFDISIQIHIARMLKKDCESKEPDFLDEITSNQFKIQELDRHIETLNYTHLQITKATLKIQESIKELKSGQ